MAYETHRDGTLPDKDNYLFVFGSNVPGIHGKGAALIAKELYGARQYLGTGLSGNSYAIPTRTFVGRKITTLPIPTVKKNIADFVKFTQSQEAEHLKFFLTRVACGLAGYPDKEIAPLFKEAKNCSFPTNWIKYL